jgi:DNA-binding CsgD family transcriptional regulator
LLASGKTIAATAEHLSLNESTVRTQTKRIFSKTRVGRQGDLIILVNQSVAQLSGDHI